MPETILLLRPRPLGARGTVRARPKWVGGVSKGLLTSSVCCIIGTPGPAAYPIPQRPWHGPQITNGMCPSYARLFMWFPLFFLEDDVMCVLLVALPSAALTQSYMITGQLPQTPPLLRACLGYSNFRVWVVCPFYVQTI